MLRASRPKSNFTVYRDRYLRDLSILIYCLVGNSFAYLPNYYSIFNTAGVYQILFNSYSNTITENGFSAL